MLSAVGGVEGGSMLIGPLTRVALISICQDRMVEDVRDKDRTTGEYRHIVTAPRTSTKRRAYPFSIFNMCIYMFVRMHA